MSESIKRVSRNEKIMIAIYSIFNFANQMSSVFLNIFLYTYSNNSLVSMAIYTICRLSMYPIFFTISGRIAEKKSYSLTLAVALSIMAAQLLYVLQFHHLFSETIAYVYLAGIIGGIGEGFMWMSMNTLNQFVTTSDSMARYLSLVGVFNNIATLTAPLIASMLINISASDMDGYILIFRIVAVVFIFLVFLAMQIKVKGTDLSYSVKECLNISGDRIWRINMISTFLYGIRDSLTVVLVNLILYDALGKGGSEYSLILGFFSLIMILVYTFYSKRIEQDKILPVYVISAFLLASSTMVLTIAHNYFGGMYYGIANAVSYPAYSNGYSVLVMDAINRFADKENMTGRVIAKEFYLDFGRIGGMLVVILFSKIFSQSMYLVVSVVIVSLFAIINVLYVHTSYRKLNYNRFGV